MPGPEVGGGVAVAVTTTVVPTVAVGLIPSPVGTPAVEEAVGEVDGKVQLSNIRATTNSRIARSRETFFGVIILFSRSKYTIAIH